ncbi:hypothetical protein RclHR1_01350023 [Rhizophagus clarus]|uniref:Uncharacterized protein n=1 Tax=Rhizophagus clarus TaxID=94130 RepID=A0A2Z6R2K0_9GLOM|nr:hypothetical protein RclHR1_01350023 [Rhizophagus clarus]GES98959.1 hypothetical protein RCL_e1078_RclHR1_01350023 [Rhizophagus clarus]
MTRRIPDEEIGQLIMKQFGYIEKLSVKRNRRCKTVHCIVRLSPKDERSLGHACSSVLLDNGKHRCIVRMFPGEMSVQDIKAVARPSLFREFSSKQQNLNSVDRLWSIRKSIICYLP